MFSNRPAARLVLMFSLGIIAGWHWRLPGAAALVPACIVAGLILALAFTRSGSQQRLKGFLILLLWFFLGALRISVDTSVLPGDTIRRFTSDTAPIELEGTLIDLPHKGGSSLVFSLEAETLITEGRRFGVRGGVLVSLDGKNPRAGDILMLSYRDALILGGLLMEPSAPRNPGERDWKASLELNGIDARLYVGEADTVTVLNRGPSDLLSRFVYPVRRSAAHSLDSLIGGEEAKFLKGLVIGERSEISPRLRSAFQNSGVMHILAVSGLHVVIAAFIISLLLGALRLPGTARAVLTCLLLVYYIFFTGAASSVARSAIMAMVFLTSRMLERKEDVYNTLAVSAIIILLLDARELLLPGFQLSYAAVLSLVVFIPKLRALKKHLPRGWVRHRVISRIADVVLISIAAGIGTLPLSAYYFGRISLIGFAANIVIVPLSNIVLALGMVTVGISWLWLPLASVMAETTRALTWLLLGGVSYAGSLPFSAVDAPWTVLAVVVYYLFVILIVSNPARGRFGITLVMALLSVSVLWVYSELITASGATLRITFLDVGQGDAAFVEFPDGRTMLVDGGPRSNRFDAGSRVITPFLRRKGISSLDAVLLTHPHSDHVGGLSSILRNFNVRRIIGAGSADTGYIFRDFTRVIDSLGLPLEMVSAGSQIRGFDNVRIYVLYPAERSPGSGLSLNDQSVVVKVLYGVSSLLLEGDAEGDVELGLERRYGSFLSSGVIKAAHHGSITSSSERFLARVRPAVAVISVGARNRFSQPSPLVLERFRAMGSVVIRTDQHGAIILASDGRAWEELEWR